MTVGQSGLCLVEQMELHLDSLDPKVQAGETVSLPLDATVDVLIAALSRQPLEGCVGFLVGKEGSCEEDNWGCEDSDDDDDGVAPAVSSGLADKLTVNGGTLLEPSKMLSEYGLNEKTCAEVVFFPVFAEAEKQPTVFKQDVEKRGLGEKVWEYVKLNKEDKQIVAARGIFSGPPLEWLQKDNYDGGVSQQLIFSMEDDFPAAPSTILTVHITQECGEMNVSCTNMAGSMVCSVKLSADDIAADLQASLCEKLQWASMTLWDCSDKVPVTKQVSMYSLLTAEQVATPESLHGCYQHYNTGHRPAGYSSSGQSLSNTLVLEPSSACLKYHFKGDYKRASELRKLVMTDAHWSIESPGEGEQVVRLSGKAVLDYDYVHERCGREGESLSGYQCFALVRIPLSQLETAQENEAFSAQSTQGSGWTCGSESYNHSFFLPMCLLNLLRRKPDGETDVFAIRSSLNSSGAADYPSFKMTGRDRYEGSYGEVAQRISAQSFEMIKFFRQRLAGKSEISMEDILELQQAFAAKPMVATK